ncbi:phage portal protein [Nocardia sp. CA-128927]|uniref:phage portal protein n=1 Tax=Nocardia sp. CA-128927 TaxID=3239975 RepID=UPI003D986880
MTIIDGFSPEETSLFGTLANRIDTYAGSNRRKLAYYEGRQRVKHLRIAVPPHLENLLNISVGWAGTAVDVLNERIDFLGWNQSDTDYGLGTVYARNRLSVEAGLAHSASLIYGQAYVCVGAGLPGEPHPLVTVESPLAMTGVYDARQRRLTSALSRVWDAEKKKYTAATLFLPDENIYCQADDSGVWRVVSRNTHNLGRVPVVRLVNRPTASNLDGRSEMSHAVRSYTDEAVRTLTGAAVSREFYATPQRYVLNHAAEQSESAGWEAIAGRVWSLPYDDENPDAKPEVGEFTAASPTPFLDQLRGLAEGFAGECGIPLSYLGFANDQASSADAIRALEARLVKRAEQRQTEFGHAWTEVAELCLLVRDGVVPESFYSDVQPKWVDANTISRAAAADEVVKLVQAGVLPADSDVVYDRLGFTETARKQIRHDQRRARVAGLADQPHDTATEPAGAAPATRRPSTTEQPDNEAA